VSASARATAARTQSFLGDEQVEGVAVTPHAQQRNRLLDEVDWAEGRVSSWNGQRIFCLPER
jgi:hypothetical protein